jgi:hypothetical protein
VTALVAATLAATGNVGAAGSGHLGDRIWQDLNANGTQDPGEPGIGSVVVKLYDLTTSTVIARATSDSQGMYAFNGLTDGGCYGLKAVAPQGYEFVARNQNLDDSRDSDADTNGVIGWPACVPSNGTSNDWDAGLSPTGGSIGNLVWSDTNRDGIRQPDEAGVANVTLELWNAQTSAKIRTTTTGSDGSYRFDGLAAGCYGVKAVAPTGRSFVARNIGTDDAIDSDADINGVIAWPACLTATAMVQNDWDAGLVTTSAVPPITALTFGAVGSPRGLAETAGYELNLLAPAEVAALGVVDQNANGLLDGGPMAVGLWSMTGQLLAETIVSGGAPVGGAFIAPVQPTTLAAGRYLVGALYRTDSEKAGYAAAVTNSALAQYVSGRRTAGTTLTAPTTVVTSPARGIIGPNVYLRPRTTKVDLVTPTATKIYQRGDDWKATVALAGTVSGASEVQARAVATTAGLGADTSWETIDTTLGDGTFSGSIRMVGGWYRIEVRALGDGTSPATDSVDAIASGEIFIAAGQSNSANFGAPAQVAQSPQVLMFNASKQWVASRDPQPLANGGGGSPWPAFGDRLVADWKVPVGVVSVGIGGTAIAQWDSTYYASNIRPIITALAPYGFRAVLWHQGESDSLALTTTDTYIARLQSLISKSALDAGHPVRWGIAVASYHPSATAAGMAAVAAAQRKIVLTDPRTFAGAVTDGFKDLGYLADSVHFNGAGLTEHGRRWSAAVQATFGHP